MLDDPLTPEQWARQQYPEDTAEQLAERAMRALALQSHWGKHVLWNLVKQHRLDVKRGPMDLAMLGGLQIPLRQAKLWTNGEHGGNYLAITGEELNAVLRGLQRCEADPSLWESVSKRAMKQNE